MSSMVSLKQPEQGCSFSPNHGPDHFPANESPSPFESNEENDSKPVERSTYSISSLLCASKVEDWQVKKRESTSPSPQPPESPESEKRDGRDSREGEAGAAPSGFNALAMFMQQMSQQNSGDPLAALGAMASPPCNASDVQQAQQFQQMYLQCLFSQFSPQFSSLPLRMISDQAPRMPTTSTSSPRIPNPLQLFAAQFHGNHPVSPSQMLPMTSGANGLGMGSVAHHQGLQLSPNSLVLQKKQSRPTFTGHQIFMLEKKFEQTKAQHERISSQGVVPEPADQVAEEGGRRPGRGQEGLEQQPQLPDSESGARVENAAVDARGDGVAGSRGFSALGDAHVSKPLTAPGSCDFLVAFLQFRMISARFCSVVNFPFTQKTTK
uniref:Uncharacterized protein n=1 Tax=Panagrolaimus sp. JU765 TaxID=591449 RepID=A0AC34R3W3_9BILA